MAPYPVPPSGQLSGGFDAKMIRTGSAGHIGLNPHDVESEFSDGSHRRNGQRFDGDCFSEGKSGPEEY